MHTHPHIYSFMRHIYWYGPWPFVSAHACRALMCMGRCTRARGTSPKVPLRFRRPGQDRLATRFRKVEGKLESRSLKSTNPKSTCQSTNHEPEKVGKHEPQTRELEKRKAQARKCNTAKHETYESRKQKAHGPKPQLPKTR